MRKKGSAVEQITEFNKAGMLERSRHASKGYTAEHDAEHGLDHLLMWAQLYLAQGEVYKGWSLIQAARDLIAKNATDGKVVL